MSHLLKIVLPKPAKGRLTRHLHHGPWAQRHLGIDWALKPDAAAEACGTLGLGRGSLPRGLLRYSVGCYSSCQAALLFNAPARLPDADNTAVQRLMPRLYADAASFERKITITRPMRSPICKLAWNLLMYRWHQEATSSDLKMSHLC